jgi:hypothetical protein
MTESRILRRASYAFVVLGVGMRLLQFLANRSLSLDEVFLALNITDRPFSGLFHQLDFNQGAPPGFLVIQKVVVRAFGTSDYSLRFVPFISGIIALVIFVPVARVVLRPAAVPLAVMVFAVSAPLIEYASADKQYGVDVLVTVAALWACFHFGDRLNEVSVVLLVGSLGAIAVWLSHASVFVFAGIFATLLGSSLAARNGRRLIGVVGASAIWLASFGIFVATSLQNLTHVQRSLSRLTGGHAGLDFQSGLPTGTGALRTSLGAFRYISGVPHFLTYGTYDAGAIIALLTMCFAAAGFVFLVMERPEKGIVLAAPLGFMLVAWGLHRYPIAGRTQLFLIPCFVLLFVHGIVEGLKRAGSSILRAVIVTCAAIAGVAVLSPALNHVLQPRTQEEMKPVLKYLSREQHRGDTLFIYYTAQYSFRYYLECGCVDARVNARTRSRLWPIRLGPGGPAQWAPALLSDPPRLIVARDRGRDPSSYLPVLDALRGRKRVWVLLSGATDAADAERTGLLRELNRLGTQRAVFRGAKGIRAAVVYLYDLSER